MECCPGQPWAAPGASDQPVTAAMCNHNVMLGYHLQVSSQSTISPSANTSRAILQQSHLPLQKPGEAFHAWARQAANHFKKQSFQLDYDTRHKTIHLLPLESAYKATKTRRYRVLRQYTQQVHSGSTMLWFHVRTDLGSAEPKGDGAVRAACRKHPQLGPVQSRHFDVAFDTGGSRGRATAGSSPGSHQLPQI